MKKIFLLISIFISIAFANSAFASRLFLPGLWQYTSTTTVSGLPYAMPPVTSTYSSCMGNKLKPPMQKNPDIPANCPKPIVTVNGNTVVTRFECSTGVGMEIKELMFEYFPNDTTMHMHGHVNTINTYQGRTMNVNSNIELTGKRIGACSVK
ncbi:MAG: DUF3617 family protein [Candidatus Acidulodesulfobacterium ferriphilum]|uniref:DUF3617 family protein n=1 Tax=Candidatus Acidulodesulfobacterium ferriphilum TaxID=2597223 RepID=A0A519BBB5_9DELT|nr:MAG: DUF3617 family protein [Candidatus Acidulodesulfobacterium ferriphilum]